MALAVSYRHRRRHVHCAGMGMPVLKMTASPSTGMPVPAHWTCRRRCRYMALQGLPGRAVRGLVQGETLEAKDFLMKAAYSSTLVP